MSDDTLHIYAQAYQHQEAWVVGTKDALTALRDALNVALASGDPTAMTAFTNDGEGYKVILWPVSEGKVQDFRTPYVDPTVPVQAGKSPFMMMDPETYRRLFRGFVIKTPP